MDGGRVAGVRPRLRLRHALSAGKRLTARGPTPAHARLAAQRSQVRGSPGEIEPAAGRVGGGPREAVLRARLGGSGRHGLDLDRYAISLWVRRKGTRASRS